MHLSTLSEWLLWITSVHTTDIELGLDRVKQVAKKLNVLTPSCPVIIVAGTNGKGSCVAALQAIYLAAQYHVGSFTSPFLFLPNEQVKINGDSVTDEVLINAFEKIEEARGEISLTPFEFHTLAALLIFNSTLLDVWILEVGLGGRLDAVNVMDADIAVIASIDIDHTDWLGDTREKIGFEKAGVFRKNKPVVYGDQNPPHSLLTHADNLSSPLYCQGKDFNYQEAPNYWNWQHQTTQYAKLPKNTLSLQNMSTTLMTITLMQPLLPVNESAIHEGLSHVTLFGRIEIIPGDITEIYDVSHNPAAVGLLANQLKKLLVNNKGRSLAVFSMLTDKDIPNSLLAISDSIDAWYVAPLNTKRAASMEKLQIAFQEASIEKADFFLNIEAAYNQALLNAKSGDRLIIFGSFHTVSEVWGLGTFT